MEVLVLGLPRTGTQSLADALSELCVSPMYHMRGVKKDGHTQAWLQAVDAKLESKGASWAPRDLLAGYQGVAEFPAAIFPGELITAYPETAIILTVRSEDSWYQSTMSTLGHSQSNSTADATAAMAVMRNKYQAHCWGNDFPAHGRAYFQKHSDLARRLGQGRKFMEYDVETGWVPLCDLLGLPAVDQAKAFPRSDDWVSGIKRW